jgi:hypothetical protein
VSRAIGLWSDDAHVGGALFRSIPLPVRGATVTECLNGPLFDDWRSEWAAPLLAALTELASDTKSIVVIVKGCQHEALLEDLQTAMRRAGSRLARQPGDREAVLPLEGRDLDEVVRGFHSGTRRAIKKGRAGPAAVRRLTTTEELRQAHVAWLATAARKGFSDVRPWETLAPVLRRSIDAGLAAVFGSVVEGRVVAAIYVTFIGRVGVYIYGGYVDGAEGHRPNHVLHLEAIRECLNRGCSAYNLGALGRPESSGVDGLDQFKLGFGALPVTRPDTLVWLRKPLLYRVMHQIRSAPVGGALENIVRRRLVRRGTAR